MKDGNKYHSATECEVMDYSGGSVVFNKKGGIILSVNHDTLLTLPKVIMTCVLCIKNIN